MVRKVRHYLNNLTKSIERNEERLRLISSTLEHSTSGHTLKRRLSPNNSMGGSINSINAALNNSSSGHNVSNTGVGLNSLSNSISAGNGSLHAHQKTISLFGIYLQLCDFILGELKSTPWGIWGGFNIFIKSVRNSLEHF
jgi:hypothetical protein